MNKTLIFIILVLVFGGAFSLQLLSYSVGKNATFS